MKRQVLLEDNIEWIPVQDLKVKEGFNPRIDYGDLEELELSIRQHGVITPLIINREDNTILDGHRRRKAASNISDDFKVPIRYYTGTEDVVKLCLALVANEGKPLIPLEEASAYLRIKEQFGCSIKALASFVGKGEAYVAERLILLDASQEVQDAVKNKEIPVSTAQEIIHTSNGDHKDQNTLLNRAKDGKEGRKAVRREIEIRRVAKRKGKELVGVELVVEEGHSITAVLTSEEGLLSREKITEVTSKTDTLENTAQLAFFLRELADKIDKL